MATLKEFEDLLREAGMSTALAILDGLRKRDRDTRAATPARRIAGKKMTADLARSILELHATTGMTQQEIAFKLGVNQGRVNEVVKRGKWLSGDPTSAEAQSRDKAMERLGQRAKARRTGTPAGPAPITIATVSVPERAVPVLVPRERTPVVVASAAQGRLHLRGAVPEPSKPKVVAEPLRPRRADAETVKRRAEAQSPKPPIISAQLAFLDL